MIGEKLSPILCEIESALWEFEELKGEKPNFTHEAFIATTKIFMSVIMDKMWELQEKDRIDMIDREKMSSKMGEDMRNIIKTYTNLDTHEFYK